MLVLLPPHITVIYLVEYVPFPLFEGKKCYSCDRLTKIVFKRRRRSNAIRFKTQICSCTAKLKFNCLSWLKGSRNPSWLKTDCCKLTVYMWGRGGCNKLLQECFITACMLLEKKPGLFFHLFVLAILLHVCFRYMTNTT